MKPEPVHIGQSIYAQLVKQHHTVAWLAEQLGMQCPNCYRILRSANINTERLVIISNVLKYDFFAEYSKRLNF